jgi:two-component system response regulator YesN
LIDLYKVLLADDEKLDLEGMKTFVPWDELRMEVVEGVSNGFAACKVLEEVKIDILVTDVNMPNMSGLELAKRALEKWKDIKIIFVSGYQDFNYAKQALSLNACDYLLKPMDDQELIDSLIKVSKIIDEERTHQELYWQMVPLVKNEYLLQLFEGSYNAAGLNVISNEYHIKDFVWPGRISILELDDIPWKLNASQEKEQAVVMNSVLQMVVSICNVHDIKQICKISNKRLALMMEEATVLSVLEQLIRQIKNELSFTMTIGVGGVFQGITEIQHSYKQATVALKYKMFQGKGKIIEYGEVRTIERDDVNNKSPNKNWKLIQEIIDYVRERMKNNITLREVAEQFSFSPNYLGLLFKEVTGKNFSEYLIKMRLEKACDLLKNTNLKIYEVADVVGHRYLPYFSRQFKETYGVTPLEYRRK